jgi:hypothetical protein
MLLGALQEADPALREACLADKVGDAVTRAYQHTTMLERRRKVMADCAAFLAGEGGPV